MANTSAAVFDGLEMGLDLVKQLKGTQRDKTKALQYLKTAIARRRRELAALQLNLRGNKYTLGELEKMANEAFRFVKAASRLNDAMVKIDPNDESVPLFKQLIDKLVAEYHAIRDKVMQTVSNKNSLDKNVIDVVNKMGTRKRPSNARTPNVAAPQSTAQPAPKIQKIVLSSADKSAISRNGLRQLPREALQAMGSASKTASSANAARAGFTTSFNRAGVLIVNNTSGAIPQSSTAGAYNNRILTQLNNQNRESSLFWNKFEEKIDVHFNDLKKVLRESANGGHGAGGGSGGVVGAAAGWLLELVESKMKNSKVLRMFSRSFYKEAYSGLQQSARDILRKGTSFFGEEGLAARSGAKVSEFSKFISGQLKSLNRVVKSSWNSAASLVDEGVNNVIGSVVKGSKSAGSAIVDFGSNIGSKLEDVKKTVVKWSAETISGLEKWESDFSTIMKRAPQTAIEGFRTAFTASKTMLANLATRGNAALAESTASIGKDLSTAAQTAPEITGAAGRSSRYLKTLGKVGRGIGKAAPFINFGVGAGLSGVDNNRLSGTTTARDRVVSGAINLAPGVSEAEMANPLINRWSRSTFLPGNVQRTFKEYKDRAADALSGGQTDHTRARQLAAQFMRDGKIDASKLGKDPNFINMVKQQLYNMSDEQNARFQNGQDYDENQLPSQLGNANTDFGKKNLQNGGVRRLTNRSIQTQAIKASDAIEAYYRAVQSGSPVPDQVIAELSPQMQRAAQAINAGMPEGYTPQGGRLLGSEQFGPNLPGGTVNAAPKGAAIGATALPGMGGMFNSAQDYIDAGMPVPARLRGKGTTSSVESTNPLLQHTAYTGSLNPQASAMLAPQAAKADGAALVRLTDDTIGNLAVVLARVLKMKGGGGEAGGGGGGFIQASYSAGGSGSSLGAGNNGATGGGFFGGGGSSSSGGGGGSSGGEGGGGGSYIAPGGIRKGHNAVQGGGGGSYIAPGGIRKGHNAVHGGGGGSAGGQSVGGSSTGSRAAAQNEIVQEAMKNGATHAQAVALAANFSGESLDPTNATGDKGTAFGIGQWHPDRKAKLFAYAKATGKNPYERKTQVAFSQHEMGITKDPASLNMTPEEKKATGFGSEGKAGREFAATQTAQEGVDALVGHNGKYGYERPGNRGKAANERYGFIGQAEGAQAQVEKEQAAKKALGSTSDQANAAMSASGPTPNVKEAQGQVAKTRRMPIQPGLKDQIQFAAEKNGVEAEIFSGGQPSEGPNRTGSHRHDNGGAADLKLYKRMPDGSRRLLDMRNPDDAKIMGGFTRDAVRAGATGVGGATDYMGPSGLHIGGGKPAAWGAGGHGAPDPMVGQAFKEGMADQEGGSAEFKKWQADRNAKIAAGGKTDNSVTAIDPQSKGASIFSPGNTPSSIKPGMGLGAMAKAMQEAPNTSAAGGIGGDGKYPLGTMKPSNFAKENQDIATANKLYGDDKNIAGFYKNRDPNSSSSNYKAAAYDSSMEDAHPSIGITAKPKIDQDAVVKKFGIGGDGTKSEADYGAGGNPDIVKSAYTGGAFNAPNTAGRLRGAGGIYTNQSDWTKATTIDPVVRNQAIAAAAMQQKGLSAAETAQGMGQIGAETGFVPRSENTHYSAAQLTKLFPSRFPTIASARAVVRQGDAAIANRIYGNRMGNKGFANAGFNYRGHGDNQLTGRDAYVKMDKALGLNGALVSNPEMANDPVIAARINAQFLSDKKKQGFDISTPAGATNATGPAGDRKANIQSRGSIAAGFNGQTDTLASQGQAEINADTKAKMSADDIGNSRVPKPDPVSAASAASENTQDASVAPSKSTTPGVGTGTGGMTKSPASNNTAPPMTSAMNYTPMTHSSLGLVVINSPGLA